MNVLNEAARAAVTAGHLAHLVTINADGSPQVSVVWIGLDGADIVSGHMGDRLKLRNVRRDSRVALSIETGVVNSMGLAEFCCSGSRTSTWGRMPSSRPVRITRPD